MADYEKGSKHTVNKNQHKIISGQAQINQKETAAKLGAVITSPITFVKWIAENWQLAAIGIVALLVLLRK